MRKFRFEGKAKYHHNRYLINFQVGESYSENRIAFTDSNLTIQDAALMYPDDWHEVTGHKDTDLGHFAGLAMQGFLANTDPELIRLNEVEIADFSVRYAKALIERLGKEAENA